VIPWDPGGDSLFVFGFDISKTVLKQELLLVVSLMDNCDSSKSHNCKAHLLWIQWKLLWSQASMVCLVRDEFVVIILQIHGQLFLQCSPTGVAGVLQKPSFVYWKAMTIQLCDEQHRLPREVMAFTKGCSVHSRSLLEVMLGGIIMLDSHFLAEELHIQLSVLGLLEEFQGSLDVCSFTEPTVLLLSNHIALLQS